MPVTPDPRRPRIFGIGMNKTGTTSLTEALRILGFNAFHWGGSTVRDLVAKALKNGQPLLEGLDPTLDAFSDIHILARNYELLDEQYPGSKFILTVRPIDSWIQSRTKHVLLNRERKAAGAYSGNFLEVDEDGWRAEWRQRVDGARAYFEGRDDFLEIDLTAGLGWDPLCTFLGRPTPKQEFPAANSALDRRKKLLVEAELDKAMLREIAAEKW